MKTTKSDIEKVLWKACDSFRGKIDSSRYKDYILSMLFVKYLSDVCTETKEKYMQQYAGDIRRVERAMSREPFVLDEESTFEYLYENRNDAEIGQKINIALNNIEEHNSGKLRNVFRAIDFNSQVDFGEKKEKNATLKNLLNDFHDLDLRPSVLESNDIIGDAYEYMIANFASDAGKKGGEFFTPSQVSKLVAMLVEPKENDRIYDPACGSGGMLIEAIRYMHDDSLCCGSIFGQEKNVVNAAIAKMNLFLHGASDFNVMQGDTLRDPKILQGGNIAKFDCVIANPPFSLENWGATEWSSDKYKRNIYGTPSDSCGDYAWIQHMICSMVSGQGRMAVVMPQGILFRNQETEIRKQLVESDLIEAVVTLGDKLFYGTGLSPCFLIIRRMKPAHHSGRILMIDGSKILTQKRAQNILEENDIDRLYSLYQNYSDEEDYSRIVTLQEIRDKEYNLSPNRYVVYHKEKIRPYAEVLAEFKHAYEEVKRLEEEFSLLINA